LALLNLLKSAYTGKLGETYGASWKGKPVVRAVPFSKAPPTPAQTKSVRAFECLNRVASAIARMGFAHTGLAAKTMHPHNAVAKFLTPTIKNKIFEPANIKEVIPAGENLRITAFAFDGKTAILTVGYKYVSNTVYDANQRVFVIVCDNHGYVQHAHLSDTPNYMSTCHIDHDPTRVYYCVIWLSTVVQGKIQLDNLDLMEGLRMQYSLAEQPTGDVWLDGKPIYQRTLNITIPDDITTAARNINFNMSDIDTLISHNVVITRGGTANQQMAQYIPSLAAPFADNNVMFIRPYVNKSNTALHMVIQCASDLYVDDYKGQPLYLTVYYTKASD